MICTKCFHWPMCEMLEPAKCEFFVNRAEVEKMMEKCKNPDGVLVLIPDENGVFHKIDPCDYEVVEAYRNVTVEVLRCKRCGHIEVSWKRQENTEELKGGE